MREYVWGAPLVLLLLFTGIWFTLRLWFLPLRYLFFGWRIALGLSPHEESSQRGKEPQARGDISPFQSLSTVLAATIGTGNIVGVAGAILIGGPGALFWMWVSAIVGMATKYAEALLAVRYREKTSYGYAGGPMYYMEKGLGWRRLAVFFSVLVLIAGLGIGNMAQIDAAATVLHSSLNIPRWQTSLLVAILASMVLMGGIRRIGQVAAVIVPFMAIMYLVAVGYYLIANHKLLARSFALVFDYAFKPLSMATGFLTGWFFVTVRTGLQHALFSNEAGLGSGPIADASARTEFAVKQGLVAMLGPFVDTLIVCTLTGLTVIVGLEKSPLPILSEAILKKTELAPSLLPLVEKASTGQLWQALSWQWGNYAENLRGVLVNIILKNDFGQLGALVVSLSLVFFAISTIFGWYFYTDRAMVYLGLGKKIRYYQAIYIATILLGGMLGETKLIWDFSHIANGLMAFPNLMALLFLTPVVLKETRIFFQKYPHRHDLAVRIYILILTILPKNTLSKIFGYLARLRLPAFIMIPILLAFSRLYKINVSEAELELKDYRSLNNFFTRALKNTARVVAPGADVIVSPVDGSLLHAGILEKGQILQSKGISCTLEEILGSKKYLEKFIDGCYATIYLSPQDYHRIHAPTSGKIIGYFYQPGKLFPVNMLAVHTIDRLFSRNERLITFIDTGKGLLALVKIGATSVGKIRVNYDEKFSTNKWIRIPRQHTYQNPIAIEKGAEIGRFEMGSTVILIFERDSVELLDLEPKQKLHYGEPIALFKKKD